MADGDRWRDHPARHLPDGRRETTGHLAPSRGAERSNMGGISLGGILVIVGIVLAIVWNLWIGIIIALIGLLAFGGFARGRWY
jgi:hypothetical protein